MLQEATNIHPGTIDEVYKIASIDLSPNILGQERKRKTLLPLLLLFDLCRPCSRKAPTFLALVWTYPAACYEPAVALRGHALHSEAVPSLHSGLSHTALLQVAMSLMVNPPKEGDESYPQVGLLLLCSVPDAAAQQCCTAASTSLHGRSSHQLHPIFVFLNLLTSAPNAFKCQPHLHRVPFPPSYVHAQYKEEQTSIIASLRERAHIMTDAFNACEGISCNFTEGAMYSFPQLYLPAKVHPGCEQNLQKKT